MCLTSALYTSKSIGSKFYRFKITFKIWCLFTNTQARFQNQDHVNHR